MSLLQALLAQDHVVSAARLDEALQRQRAEGGDLATSLLEIGAVGEDTLAAYWAAAAGLSPASRAEVVEADPDAVALIPTDLAVSFGAVGLYLDPEGKLVMAVAGTPTDDARARLEAAARRAVSFRGVTPFRLAWALWRSYGTALDPRVAALAEALFDAPPGPMPTVRPAAFLGTAGPSQEPGSRVLRSLAALLDEDDDDDDEDEDDDAVAAVPETPAEVVVDPGERPTAEAPAPVPVIRPRSAADTPAPLRKAPPSTRPLPLVAASESASPPQDQLRLPGTREALAAPLVPRFDPLPPSSPPPAPAPQPAPEAAPQRPAAAAPAAVPVAAEVSESDDEEALSLPEAEAWLAAADSRDAVVAAMLRHVVQDFAYAALFVLRNERVEGLAARGRGADTPTVRRIQLPLADVALLRTARDRAQAVLETPTRQSPEDALRSALGRGEAEVVVVVPVPIQGKVSLLLWADAGPHRPDGLSIRALEQFVTRCGQAFGRLVTARKLGASVAPPAGASSAPSVRLPAPGAPSVASPASAAASSGLSHDRPRERSGQPSPEARMAALRAAVMGPPGSRRSAPPPGPSPTPVSSRSPQRSPPPRMATPRPGTARPLTPRPLTPRPLTPRPETYSGATVPGTVGPRLGTLTDADQRVAEVARTGILTDETAATLIAMGERSLEAVFRHFPGPHLPPADMVGARLSGAAELGPVIRLALRFRAAAVPWFLGVLDRGDGDARACALACLAEVAHPSALPAMTSLFLDGDHPTRLAVIESLKAFRAFAEFQPVVRTLRTLVRDQRSGAEVRRMAALALGELRDEAAVPVLIEALTDTDGTLATACHGALVTLCRQDFGITAEAWRPWWERMQSRHRIEWLMEALLHAEAGLRHAASEELKQVTGQFFGYYFNLPRRERERAQQRYVAWWRREGALRFTGKPAP